MEINVINQNLETISPDNMMDVLSDGVAWGNKCIELFNQEYSKLLRKIKETAYNKK
jgi:hypothetical protein